MSVAPDTAGNSRGAWGNRGGREKFYGLELLKNHLWTKKKRDNLHPLTLPPLEIDFLEAFPNK